MMTLTDVGLSPGLLRHQEHRQQHPSDDGHANTESGRTNSQGSLRSLQRPFATTGTGPGTARETGDSAAVMTPQRRPRCVRERGTERRCCHRQLSN